jgi:hypothetical protein
MKPEHLLAIALRLAAPKITRSLMIAAAGLRKSAEAPGD